MATCDNHSDHPHTHTLSSSDGNIESPTAQTLLKDKLFKTILGSDCERDYSNLCKCIKRLWNNQMQSNIYVYRARKL